jgi:hypothetical protein
MEFKKAKQAIINFAENVVKQSKQNLVKQDKNVTKKLFESIKFKDKTDKDVITIILEMLDYGQYQDLGVSGTKRKFKTPFKYTSKGGVRGLKGMPPASPLDQWSIKKKKLKTKVRDKKGRFIPRKTLVFLIRKKIFEQGIKPSLFFSKPFNDGIKELRRKLGDALEIDIKNL